MKAIIQMTDFLHDHNEEIDILWPGSIKICIA